MLSPTVMESSCLARRLSHQWRESIRRLVRKTASPGRYHRRYCSGEITGCRGVKLAGLIVPSSVPRERSHSRRYSQRWKKQREHLCIKRFTRVVSAEAGLALENTKLVIVRTIIPSPANRRGHRGRLDLRATGIFRHAQEYRAAAQIKSARTLLEAEDGLSAKTSQSLISEGQLTSGFHASSDRSVPANIVVHRGRSRCSIGRKYAHVANHLCNAGFFKRICAHPAWEPNRKSKCK